jgi:hypothetical protein
LIILYSIDLSAFDKLAYLNQTVELLKRARFYSFLGFFVLSLAWSIVWIVTAVTYPNDPPKAKLTRIVSRKKGYD